MEVPGSSARDDACTPRVDTTGSASGWMRCEAAIWAEVVTGGLHNCVYRTGIQTICCFSRKEVLEIYGAARVLSLPLPYTVICWI